MAHEITRTDHLVLAGQPAWHGLGTVVENAPTPAQALKLARLDWTVETWPLLAQAPDGAHLAVTGTKGSYRTDTRQLLGTVGTNYRPIQNTELADFCTALAEGTDTVRVESAGSIRGGAKVWFLLRGNSFSVRGKDEVRPYYCISNGHDGWTAFRCTPTTVRVVCSNTLHMVIPSGEREGVIDRTKQAAFVCHHTTSITKRVEEAKAALGLYGKALDTTREVIDSIAAKDVKREDIQRFFLECYTHDFGGIPTNPKTAPEEAKAWNAKAAFNAVAARFDAERGVAGATLWNAFNAYTGWLQNDKLPKTKDEAKAAEQKLASKLFGTDVDRAHHALQRALALAV